MKDLLVLMGASERRGTMDEYLRQLEAAGIDVRLVDVSDRPNQNGGGNLGYRVRIFRQLAEQNSDYKFLVVSDAFDVTFYGTKEYVLERIPENHLLHAAEKNCYPVECQSLAIFPWGPHRYANGGLVAGTPEQFLRWCDYAPTHKDYNPAMLDQQFLNILVSEQSMFCEIDHATDLFFCLYGGYDELQFEKGIPVNTTYGTHPCFIHANGKWTAEEMFARRERSLQ